MAASGLDLRQYVDPEAGTLSPRIYVDPELYALEQERLFRRSWLYLGHETQIPNPNDFITAYMAEDPIIVVRQKDGSVAAFLNQCRHRGMRLCRTDAGRTSIMMCPYHGWSYSSDGGRLVGVPQEKTAYHGEINKDDWDLTRVSQVASYKGLIFGCWDPDAPDLRTYLGDVAYYLDGFIDRVDGGTEIIGMPHKWTIDCNWKLPAEQFCSDMYHAATTHQSAVRVMAPPDVDMKVQGFRDIEGVQYSDHGHGGGFALADRPMPNVWFEPLAQQWLYDTYPEVQERLGTVRAARFSGHCTIFPNLSFLVGTQTLRVWHPRGPDKIEVWAWVLVDRKAPAATKEAFRLGAVRAFGPGGILEQDDGDNWVEVQRVLRGHVARETKLNVQMGLGHEFRRSDLPGNLSGILSENAARTFYRRWRDELESENWADLQQRQDGYKLPPLRDVV